MTLDEIKEKAKKSLDDFDKKANDIIGRLKRINEKMEDNVELVKEINDRLKPNTEENKSVYEVMEEWRAKWQDATIKNAMEENKVYDIDRLFWNDGKLFGYDTYYIEFKNPDGELVKKFGPFTKIKRKVDSNKFMGLTNEREYEVKFTFDWNLCALSLTCNSYNPYICEPVGAKETITFDTLFGVKPEVVKDLIDFEIYRLIKEIDKLINDGKKDNRNS